LKSVRCFGVAEKTGGLAAAIVSGLRFCGPPAALGAEDTPLLLMHVADGPARLRESGPELLVLSASSALEDEPAPLHFRCVLIPGETAGSAARVLSSDCAISYGMSPKDSLTFPARSGSGSSWRCSGSS
jgi:hypothetical protein